MSLSRFNSAACLASIRSQEQLHTLSWLAPRKTTTTKTFLTAFLFWDASLPRSTIVQAPPIIVFAVDD